MRVLVTGHAGYVGASLVPMLRLAGHRVVGVDNGLFSDAAFCAPAGSADVELHADVRDLHLEHFADIDAVVHLAALPDGPWNERAEILREINYRSTVHVAQTAKRAGVCRFVFSSSCSVYGPHEDTVVDESAELGPVGPHAKAVALAEHDLAELADQTFSPTFLRITAIYGVSPQLRLDHTVNNLVGHAVATGNVPLPNGGGDWLPSVHVEDVARAFLSVVEAPREVVHAKTYNVGRADESYRVHEIADMVAEVVGATIASQGVIGRDPADHLVSNQVDCSLIAAELPSFRPQWTLRRGIEELCDAYRQVGFTDQHLKGVRFQRYWHLRSLGTRVRSTPMCVYGGVSVCGVCVRISPQGRRRGSSGHHATLE
jgi:nucleoside-diphosphate-sugar epimerase